MNATMTLLCILQYSSRGVHMVWDEMGVSSSNYHLLHFLLHLLLHLPFTALNESRRVVFFRNISSNINLY